MLEDHFGRNYVTAKKANVIAASRLPITDLYQNCLANEETWTKVDFGKMQTLLFKSYILQKPLFPPEPTLADSLGTTSSEKQRDLRISRLLYDGNKYRSVVELLQNARDRRTRLSIIALWLAEERICEPEGILGSEELQRQAAKMFRGLSASDFRHADTVRAWIPYFERLLPDLRTAKHNRDLVSRGYEEGAVQAASKKRSPVAAACEWLAKSRPSLNITGATFANAYSRLYGSRRLLSRRFIRPGKQ